MIRIFYTYGPNVADPAHIVQFGAKFGGETYKSRHPQNFHEFSYKPVKYLMSVVRWLAVRHIKQIHPGAH